MTTKGNTTRRMGTLAGLLVLSLGLLSTLAAPVSAQEGGEPPQLHIEAVSTADPACEGGNGILYCLRITQGGLDLLAPGGEAVIVYWNNDTVEHDLHLADLADADPDRTATDVAVAFAGTQEPVAPATFARFHVAVPEDLAHVYLWCSLGGHEQFGMWLSTRPGDAPGAADAQRGAPAPGLVAFLGLAGVAGAAWRPRRAC